MFSLVTARRTAAVVAGGALLCAPALLPSASAATTPRCNSVIQGVEYAVPGVNGTKVPCTIPYGSRGPVVVAMQKFLTTYNGIPVRADGVYGPATKQAVATFQRSWSNGYRCASSPTRLTVDGLYGPMTSTAVQRAISVASCDGGATPGH